MPRTEGWSAEDSCSFQIQVASLVNPHHSHQLPKCRKPPDSAWYDAFLHRRDQHSSRRSTTTIASETSRPKSRLGWPCTCRLQRRRNRWLLRKTRFWQVLVINHSINFISWHHKHHIWGGKTCKKRSKSNPLLFNFPRPIQIPNWKIWNPLRECLESSSCYNNHQWRDPLTFIMYWEP